MKNVVNAAIVGAFAFSATAVYAGGPVEIADDEIAEAEKPASSVGILPLLLIPIILCVALCGGDDDEQPPR